MLLVVPSLSCAAAWINSFVHSIDSKLLNNTPKAPSNVALSDSAEVNVAGADLKLESMIPIAHEMSCRNECESS
jgi:hypothetical protein